MEDKESKQPIYFEKQLKNIQTLQQRINQTKKELSHLFKMENSETKNIKDIFKQTLMLTRNKLNLYQNHQILEHHHQNISQQIKSKQSKVKEIRTKEQNELKAAKETMKKSKEDERNLIRNNSICYNLAIKRNKEAIKQMKQKLVNEIKQEKENYKQTLLESRANQTKLKEAKLLNQALAKIQRQPLLVIELDRLTKQKEEIEHKVSEKRKFKLHLKEDVQKIKRLQKSKIAQILNQGLENQDLKKSKVSQLEPQKIDIMQQKKLLSSMESINNIQALIPDARLELKP